MTKSNNKTKNKEEERNKKKRVWCGVVWCGVVDADVLGVRNVWCDVV